MSNSFERQYRQLKQLAIQTKTQIEILQFWRATFTRNRPGVQLSVVFYRAAENCAHNGLVDERPVRNLIGSPVEITAIIGNPRAERAVSCKVPNINNIEVDYPSLSFVGVAYRGQLPAITAKKSVLRVK